MAGLYVLSWNWEKIRIAESTFPPFFAGCHLCQKSMYHHLFAGFLLCQHLLNMYYHPLTLLCQHLLNMYYRLLTQLYYGMSSLSSKEFLNSHKTKSPSMFSFVNNAWKCVAWCTLWLTSFSFSWSIWYEMTPVAFVGFFSPRYYNILLIPCEA